MDYNDIERLAFVQAVYNLAGKQVSTKEPDNLRANVDEHFEHLFRDTGAKSFEVRIGDEKVGIYSIRQSKAKPPVTRNEFVVEDESKAVVWLATLDSDFLYQFVGQHLEEFTYWYATMTGEIPDGCEWCEVTEPGTEPAYLGGTLKVDAEKVLSAVSGLDSGFVGLLEG